MARIDFGNIKLVKKNSSIHELNKGLDFNIPPPQSTSQLSQIEIPFKLLATDKNNNKYYTYPTNQERFKKEAFANGGIYVGVIHHNGYIEYIERQVSKIWDTSVYWNINSMPTGYKDLKHLSYVKNLIVYACPIKYNLKFAKQWQQEIAFQKRKKNV